MSEHYFLEQAENFLKKIGARVTSTRKEVLAFLLAQKSAVTHHQIEIALNLRMDIRLDRVTLYRALDFLVEVGLVYKMASVDRAWRFQINDVEQHQHAHFKCNHCAKVVCLHDVPAVKKIPPLPKGYQGIEIEWTVKGLCAGCV